MPTPPKRSLWLRTCSQLLSSPPRLSFKFALLLVVAILFLFQPLESSVEFLFENIGGKAEIIIFVPYGELFFQKAESNKQTTNYISINIVGEKDEVFFQKEVEQLIDKESLAQHPHINFEYEYLPIFFSADLQPGKYYLIITLFAPETGQKRLYNELLIVSKEQRKIGSPILIASANAYQFVIRDIISLHNEYDSIYVWQPFEEAPDTSFVLISYIQDEKSNKFAIPSDSLNSLTNIFKDKQEVSLSVITQYGEKSYQSSLIYPTINYFYNLRFTPEKQLAQLRNIINQNEYQMLRSVESQNLQGAIDNYWQSINPDIFSIDNYYQRIFYARVMYTNKNFGVAGYLDGWQTDRGRIYLRYGEPDSITSDAFPIGRSPTIKWDYYELNKTFIFYDLGGYGNYELKDKWAD